MKISHHPSEELLLDYCSGALSEGWSLSVATHLALCPECRQLASRLDDIGSVIFETPARRDVVSDDMLDSILNRIEDPLESERVTSIAMPRQAAASVCLPRPLRDYVGGDVESVEWRKLGLGAYESVLVTGDETTTTRLLRIPAGKPVPEHTHGGLELTIVLAGAFDDETGSYGRGDFQEADESVMHQPHAAMGQDCICLAVTDAPLKFRSVAARLIQPFIGI